MTGLKGAMALLRIHIGESDRYGDSPLFQALIDLFIHEGFPGATAIKGVAGFGSHTLSHGDKPEEPSDVHPVIVEVIATWERIEEVMPTIDEMVSDGLITVENVEVIRFCSVDDQQRNMKEA